MDQAVALPEVDEPVGMFLRRQRLAGRLTQAQVASRAGVARPNLAAIESGHRAASPEMAVRLMDAIRGRVVRKPVLEMSPPVLLNVELARVAARHVARSPDSSRAAMSELLAKLRARDDGSSASWLDDWEAILDRWDVAEVISLLLSTDAEAVERRKVSPISAVISQAERDEAARSAREFWNAARRVP
jgi:transcriptional regulator with XRE-family HTH domain